MESKHGPGVVAFVGGELARYHAFTMCFTGLNVPAGSTLYSGVGYDVSYNRNAVIFHALFDCRHCQNPHPTAKVEGCPGFEPIQAEWIQMWDDDHVFAPDTLIKLLDTGADVVVPFYTQRQPPFRPCIFKEENKDGSYSIFTYEDLEGKSGLLPIASAGAGGIVIRRAVFEKVYSPWFERQGLIGEDHYFLKKCREAGFQPHVDLDTRIGHCTTVEVWPNKGDQNQWGARVDLKGKPPHQQLVDFWPSKYGAQ